MKIRRLIIKIYYQYIFFKFILKFKIIGYDNTINYMSTCDSIILPKLLRYLGATIGDSTIIESPLIINSNSSLLLKNLTIGNNCYLAKNIFIDVKGKIEIGDNAIIGMGSYILSHLDLGGSVLSNEYKTEYKRTIIGNDTYFGANCTFLPGVRIGNSTIVGAGSIITRDIKSKRFYAGNPARELKELK